MIGWQLARPDRTLSVLCLGAHADDIEIGAGGTLLGWIAAGLRLQVCWCVLSAPGARAAEARASAAAFLAGAATTTVELGQFEDGFFPYQGHEIKVWLEDLRARIEPDVVLTHRGGDAHQDHREVCQLTWNLFRDHLILEYEIPKWDGDLGRTNLYVPVDEQAAERKIAHLLAAFPSQADRDWFTADAFRAMLRLRGLEARSPSGFAEAFVARKLII